MIFTSSTYRSVTIGVVVLLASCGWCIANNDQLQSSPVVADQQLSSSSVVQDSAASANSRFDGLLDKQPDKRDADTASATSATGKPPTTSNFSNNNNNHPRSAELRDLSSTSLSSSSVPVASAQYRAIYSSYPAYTKFYTAPATAASQIIYVKAPSNQQIHAAVDGSAKIAYVAGGNYGQQSAEYQPQYQLVYTQSKSPQTQYQPHNPQSTHLVQNIIPQAPQQYPSFVLTHSQQPQPQFLRSAEPSHAQSHPTTFHQPPQQGSHQFQPLQTYSTAAPQPYSTPAPSHLVVQTQPTQSPYQFETPDKQQIAYQQYYQNQKQLQQHLLQQQQHQLQQQQQQLQHQQQQQQLYLQQHQLQQHQLQLQQQQTHQQPQQNVVVQQPQYHRAVQVQQHSNGAAAVAPTRSPIVYYASSSGHPAANNPVHPYFAYSTTPSNAPSVHNLQPAVPTFASPTPAKQFKQFAAASPVASLATSPGSVHPNHLTSHHHISQHNPHQHHPQTAQLENGNHPTSSHQGATSYATFTQHLNQQHQVSPTQTSHHQVFVKQQPGLAQSHYQHPSSYALPAPVVSVQQQHPDKSLQPPISSPSPTHHLVYGGAGQNLLVASASSPHHQLVYANTVQAAAESSSADHVVGSAGTIHYGTHLFQPSIGRYSYTPVQHHHAAAAPSPLLGQLQPNQQHRLVFA